MSISPGGLEAVVERLLFQQAFLRKAAVGDPLTKLETFYLRHNVSQGEADKLKHMMDTYLKHIQGMEKGQLGRINPSVDDLCGTIKIILPACNPENVAEQVLNAYKDEPPTDMALVAFHFRGRGLDGV